MGLITDYFMAESDEDAARTIDWIGGPEVPADGTEAYPVASLPGIEPLVMLGTVDTLLTGRTFDEVLADPSGHEVASRDGGERLVWALTEALQTALAEADESGLEAIAGPWSESEEFSGQGDPVQAAEMLIELAALVRVGRAAGRSLYCWVCV
ncbi:MAG: hypothetical protein JWM89_1327 [Acidimicrobiales bacterium]|nr:hypothetical protein [Acidimicrobiales bacterium]